ncbi:hypothetical protein B0H10DRAFT_2090775 [Mycena sp. CBHHK59/15]|nr:hypothetical protein B0H10DRAFT_2090775 [Mycena sp. CBHHK59/15]
MSLRSGRIDLPLEISFSVLACLTKDRDHGTLMVCSLVCHTWFSITRPHLFQNVIIPQDKTCSFLEIMSSARNAPMVMTLSHIRAVDFHGLHRLLHVYPPTGEDLQYTDNVGAILQIITQCNSLRLGQIHWPNIKLRETTIAQLVQMNLDCVVMMDLTMLVEVIANMGAMETLRLNVHFTQMSARPLLNPISCSLQRLKSLDCDHINDHRLFAWLVSHSPMPPITSLRLGNQLFPHTPGALQLIKATSDTLQFFMASRILSSKACLPDLFSCHTRLRTVTLFVKEDCSVIPKLFSNRAVTPAAHRINERRNSYTVLTFSLGGELQDGAEALYQAEA